MPAFYVRATDRRNKGYVYKIGFAFWMQASDWLRKIGVFVQVTYLEKSPIKSSTIFKMWQTPELAPELPGDLVSPQLESCAFLSLFCSLCQARRVSQVVQVSSMQVLLTGESGHCNYVMAPSSELGSLLHLGHVLCTRVPTCTITGFRREQVEHQQDKTISVLQWHILCNRFLAVYLLVCLC